MEVPQWNSLHSYHRQGKMSICFLLQNRRTGGWTGPAPGDCCYQGDGEDGGERPATGLVAHWLVSHFFYFSFSVFFLCSWFVKQKRNTELQKEICKHLGPLGHDRVLQLEGTLQPPSLPDKLVSKYTKYKERMFPLTSGGAEHRAELACLG
jgi:hypothetical protein